MTALAVWNMEGAGIRYDSDSSGVWLDRIDMFDNIDMTEKCFPLEKSKMNIKSSLMFCLNFSQI